MERKSTKLFDSGLDAIAHYQHYPLMKPFVGQEYAKSKKKILLIAESFYLPDECTLNKEVQTWYQGNESMLSEYERPWIDCRGLVECEWESAGHFIYRELQSSMQTVGLDFNSVSFMNAFQRPACEEGRSFSYDCTNLDVEYAIETINSVQEVIKPDCVIFVAKYPWDTLGAYIQQSVGTSYGFVCHPCTGGRYWHNTEYAHGKSKFLELLKSVQ